MQGLQRCPRRWRCAHQPWSLGPAFTCEQPRCISHIRCHDRSPQRRGVAAGARRCVVLIEHKRLASANFFHSDVFFSQLTHKCCSSLLYIPSFSPSTVWMQVSLTCRDALCAALPISFEPRSVCWSFSIFCDCIRTIRDVHNFACKKVADASSNIKQSIRQKRTGAKKIATAMRI